MSENRKIEQPTVHTEQLREEILPPSSIEQFTPEDGSSERVIPVPEIKEDLDVQPPVTPKLINAPYYGFPIPDDVQERLPTPIEAGKRKREGLSPLH